MGFLGSRLSGARANGFEFGFWLVDRVGEDVAPHGHHEAHVMWALSGDYRTGARGPAPAGAGDVIIYNPAGTYHADRFETLGAAFFSVAIDPADCALADSDLDLRTHPIRIGGEKIRSILRRMLRECGANLPDASLAGESLGHELLSALSQNACAEDAAPRWLNRLCEMLRSGRQHTLSELAAEAGVHPTHLIRTFKKHMNCTPGEFARGERTKRVADALVRTEQGISEIAAENGFADQSHMTNEFRRSFGVTPAAYRQNALNCLREPPAR